jgi:hypothetical protein
MCPQRLFYGAVRCEPEYADSNGPSGSRYYIVKLLQRADAITMTVFTPSTATTRRFDVTAAFVFRVLQCMQFCNLSLSSSPQARPHLDRDGMFDSTTSINALMELVHIMRGPWRLLAMRCIVSFLEAFGAEEPKYSMMPEVRAARQRAQEEERERIQAEALAQETEWIIRVQSRVRQLLARGARLQLALVCHLAVEL